MIAPVVSLKGRDFIDLADLDRRQLRQVLDLAHEIKAGKWSKRPLQGRHIAMLFQKPSHRTRVSFEVGIARLGGSTTTLTENDVRLGVRETISDAARVLDRYVDGVVARLRSHDDLVALARASEKPVINGLTDRSHPCQVLADLLTLEEVAGSLAGQRVVYIGDGNNMATSLIEASALTGITLTVVSPAGYEPPSAVIERARSIDSGTHTVTLTNEITNLDNATAIYTDVWTSMGQERDQESRRRPFMPSQSTRVGRDPPPGAFSRPSRPAPRGGEAPDGVTAASRWFFSQQAKTRLYAQMALMAQ